jgi:ZIP family zinc transporter
MFVILFSAAAGICGMGLGGLASSILLKRPSNNMACWLLSFAAGIMVSIVCFGLVPEAFELAGAAASVSGLLLGIVIIMALNRIIGRITGKKEKLKVHHLHGEPYHESHIVNDRARMFHSGILMIIAISLHNVPEGIAIGAGGSYDLRLGAILAIMIALHNIPEGMAVAAPLLAGGVNRRKVVFLPA